MIRRPAALARIGALACACVVMLCTGSPRALAQNAENTVVVYVAQSAGDVQKYTARFQAEHPGITVQSLRLESDQVPAKLAIEQRGGVFNADVAISPGYQADQLKRTGLIVPYKAPESKDFQPGYTDPQGFWAAWVVNTETVEVNTEKLKEFGLKLPTAYADFTKPEWRGKFVIYSGSYEWYSAMHRALGPGAADALMKALAANQPHFVGSHQLAVDLTAAGEYAAGLNVFGYNVVRYQHQGRPVELVSASPVIGELLCVSLVKNAPHPGAARIFIRWLLSHDTQQWMVQPSNIGRISARKDVSSDPEIWNAKLHIVVSNPTDSLNYANNVRAFNDTFGITQ